MFPTVVIAALLFGSAAGVSSENQAMLRDLQALDTRVSTTGHRLAVAGLPFCPENVARPGFTVHGLVQYRTALRVDAIAHFGLGAAPVVLAIAPGSAAAQAGLRAGDTIMRVAGVDVSTTMAADKDASFEPVRAFEARIETALANGPMALTVERGGMPVNLVIVGDRGCASRFQLDPSNRLSASSDGTYVKIASRLAEFASSDDELALLLAHELSHNILRHRERLAQRGKGRPRVRATEDEADRLALYLMARAGYDISIAPAFWDRAMRKAGPAILSDGTHAGRRERMTIAEHEIALIRAQQALGDTPMPEWLDTPRQQSPSQPEFPR